MPERQQQETPSPWDGVLIRTRPPFRFLPNLFAEDHVLWINPSLSARQEKVEFSGSTKWTQSTRV